MLQQAVMVFVIRPGGGGQGGVEEEEDDEEDLVKIFPSPILLSSH
jgi:hypothetical protein